MRLSEQVIGAAMTVHQSLGHGFLESVYEQAFAIELNKIGLPYEVQKPIEIFYNQQIVGHFIADVIVDNRLIVELKALSGLNGQHEAQVLNYLKATSLKVGLLLNFGNSRLQIKRLVNGYDDTQPI